MRPSLPLGQLVIRASAHQTEKDKAVFLGCIKRILITNWNQGEF